MPILWLVAGSVLGDIAPLLKVTVLGLLAVGIVATIGALRFELSHRQDG